METLIEMGGLTAVVWGASEGIGNALGANKARVALVLGPLSGIVARITGLLDLGVGPDASAWAGLGVAAFMGGVATMAAAAAHNQVINPAVKGSRAVR